MSKEATIIQLFNDVKQQYEYSVKGYDVTESVKILLKRHKEEYDKEKNVFAGTQGFIEAQQLYEKHIADLEAKLAEKDKEIEKLKKFDDLNKTFFDLFRTAFKEPNKVDDLFNTLKTMQEKQDQDKISFAIEQLEKVKKIIDRNYFCNVFTDCCTFDKIKVDYQINQQINELKGDENEKEN